MGKPFGIQTIGHLHLLAGFDSVAITLAQATSNLRARSRNMSLHVAASTTTSLNDKANYIGTVSHDVTGVIARVAYDLGKF